MKQVFGFLAGSAAVYLLVASCSSDPFRAIATHADDAGAGGDTSAAGGSATGLDARVGANGGAGGTNSADAAMQGQRDAAVRGLRDALSDAADRVVDPVPDADAQEQSGDRLKARWLTTPDGARQFVGWRDTDLGIDCVPRRHEDGSLRCLPLSVAGPAYLMGADCDQRVSRFLIAGDTSCGTTEAARVTNVTLHCGEGSDRVLVKGAQVDAPSKFCDGTPNPNPGAPWFEANQAPATMFARFSEVTD